MKPLHPGALSALVLACTGAFLPARAQSNSPPDADAGFSPQLSADARVIGPGNFVLGGSNTQIRLSATYYLLCTTITQEACAPVVTRATMDGIAIITHSAPDGTPLIDFNTDPHSTRDPVNLANAIARFVGRMTIAADILASPARSRADAPDSAAVTETEPDKPKKCSDATTPGAGLAAAGENSACSGDGGDVPNAGTVVVSAPYQSPEPPPSTDVHGDPITPPAVKIPVVIVPGPRTNDAPIIIPLPEPIPPISYPDSSVPPKASQTAWPIESAPCIPTPLGWTCVIKAKRPVNPNTVPPMPGVSNAPWWAWWKWERIDWCKMIGYGCQAKQENREPDIIDQLLACQLAYAAAVTYCTQVELKNRGATAYGTCMKEATVVLNQCVQDIKILKLVSGTGSTQ
jgi:hypothetical protein